VVGFVLGGVFGGLVGAPEGSLIQFDQTKFFPPNVPTGMADTAYAYVPKTCTAAGARCALHVALHGCLQTTASIGTKFVEGTGYNRWADTNGIIVLYPQIGKSKLASNPQDCWDWWGYTGSTWLEKRAPQMMTISAMVNQLKARAQQ
jgi:poly(3-hydroxybutyrate) depolymerase